MEFNFHIEDIIPNRITVVESKDSSSILNIHCLKTVDNLTDERNWICNVSSNVIWDASLRKKQENLEVLIDCMGLASSKAQELVLPITTFQKLLNSTQQKLYIIREDKEPFSIIGILKIGLKKLFICDDMNAQHEIDALCVLDFYIHESKQRCGYGYELFESMLKSEEVEPAKLAIDRPSFKFLSFLSKHYGLKEPKPQANNFVIYSGFLERSDLKPPIFLYNPKDNSVSQSKNLKNCNITKSLNSLQSIPVSFPKDFEETFDGKCRHLNTNSSIDSYYKKKRIPSALSSSPCTQKNWSVYDALHSYSESNNSPNSYANSSSSKCTLTPVNNGESKVDRKWTQLQSSWNVLGVQPPNYAMSEKNS